NIIEKSPTPKTKREFKRSSFWGWVIFQLYWVGDFSVDIYTKFRILIEHVNRLIKRFKMFSYRYRNKQLKHLLRVSLVCGLINFEMGF
ncbi:MAG: hypothetical protein LBK41_06455, partial [Clostridiales bacterium]|nr:hypothetical protein [Clostridiales bacterium]